MGLAPILVVDDEPDMRSALSHALNRGGFSVESAASGTEALVKLKKDPFSMVITDLKMPEMSGIDLLDAVKKISPQVPVIMITAFGSVHNAVEAMQEGAADYLLKPFSFESLETAVKKILKSAGGNGNRRACGSEADGYFRAGSECGCQPIHHTDSGRKRNRQRTIGRLYP
jgi:two-component system response regulator FlrC